MAEHVGGAESEAEVRAMLADAEAEVTRLRERVAQLEGRLAAAQRELMGSRYERPPHWG